MVDAARVRFVESDRFAFAELWAGALELPARRSASSSPEYRRWVRLLDTAIRNARRCPITTTCRFPRVMPV